MGRILPPQHLFRPLGANIKSGHAGARFDQGLPGQKGPTVGESLALGKAGYDIIDTVGTGLINRYRQGEAEDANTAADPRQSAIDMLAKEQGGGAAPGAAMGGAMGGRAVTDGLDWSGASTPSTSNMQGQALDPSGSRYSAAADLHTEGLPAQTVNGTDFPAQQVPVAGDQTRQTADPETAQAMQAAHGYRVGMENEDAASLQQIAQDRLPNPVDLRQISEEGLARHVEDNFRRAQLSKYGADAFKTAASNIASGPAAEQPPQIQGSAVGQKQSFGTALAPEARAQLQQKLAGRGQPASPPVAQGQPSDAMNAQGFVPEVSEQAALDVLNEQPQLPGQRQAPAQGAASPAVEMRQPIAVDPNRDYTAEEMRNLAVQARKNGHADDTKAVLDALQRSSMRGVRAKSLGDWFLGGDQDRAREAIRDELTGKGANPLDALRAADIQSRIHNRDTGTIGKEIANEGAPAAQALKAMLQKAQIAKTRIGAMLQAGQIDKLQYDTMISQVNSQTQQNYRQSQISQNYAQADMSKEKANDSRAFRTPRVGEIGAHTRLMDRLPAPYQGGAREEISDRSALTAKIREAHGKLQSGLSAAGVDQSDLNAALKKATTLDKATALQAFERKLQQEGKIEAAAQVKQILALFDEGVKKGYDMTTLEGYMPAGAPKLATPPAGAQPPPEARRKSTFTK